MNCLDIFDRLSPLSEDKAAFNKEADKVWEEIVSDLPPERKRWANQQRWVREGKLRQIKDPVERMNRSVEMFWEDFRKFQETLNGVSNAK
jgi:hypothetical protein